MSSPVEVIDLTSPSPERPAKVDIFRSESTDLTYQERGKDHLGRPVGLMVKDVRGTLRRKILPGMWLVRVGKTDVRYMLREDIENVFRTKHQNVLLHFEMPPPIASTRKRTRHGEGKTNSQRKRAKYTEEDDAEPLSRLADQLREQRNMAKGAKKPDPVSMLAAIRRGTKDSKTARLARRFIQQQENAENARRKAEAKKVAAEEAQRIVADLKAKFAASKVADKRRRERELAKIKDMKQKQIEEKRRTQDAKKAEAKRLAAEAAARGKKDAEAASRRAKKAADGIMMRKKAEKRIADRIAILRKEAMRRGREAVQRRKKEAQRRKRIAEEAKRRKAAADKARAASAKATATVGKTLSQMVRTLAQCHMTTHGPRMPMTSIPFITGAVKGAGPRSQVIDLHIFASKTRTTRFFGVNGSALDYPDIRALLPKNYKKDKKKGFVGKKGPKFLQFYAKYHYNTKNRELLTALLHCVNKVNLICRLQDLVSERAPYLLNPNKKVGILGWDVECRVPAWVTSTLVYDRRMLKKYPGLKQPTFDPVKHDPRITANGHYNFYTGPIDREVIKSCVHHLINHDSTRWRHLAKGVAIAFRANDPRHITKASSDYRKIIQKQSSSPSAFVIDWTGHARTAYLDRSAHMMYIIDPWMQTLDVRGKMGAKGYHVLVELNLSNGIETQFIKRSAEQGAEPTCVICAFMRLLTIAQQGVEGVTAKIPCYYPIMATRLISMYRKVHHWDYKK